MFRPSFNTRLFFCLLFAPANHAPRSRSRAPHRGYVTNIYVRQSGALAPHPLRWSRSSGERSGTVELFRHGDFHFFLSRVTGLGNLLRPSRELNDVMGTFCSGCGDDSRGMDLVRKFVSKAVCTVGLKRFEKRGICDVGCIHSGVWILNIFCLILYLFDDCIKILFAFI